MALYIDLVKGNKTKPIKYIDEKYQSVYIEDPLLKRLFYSDGDIVNKATKLYLAAIMLKIDNFHSYNMMDQTTHELVFHYYFYIPSVIENVSVYDLAKLIYPGIDYDRKFKNHILLKAKFTKLTKEMIVAIAKEDNIYSDYRVYGNCLSDEKLSDNFYHSSFHCKEKVFVVNKQIMKDNLADYYLDKYHIRLYGNDYADV